MKRISAILVILLSITVYVSAQKYRGDKRQTAPETINDKYSTGLFRTSHGTVFDLQNEQVDGYVNVLDWLNGRVAGLQVYITRSGVRVPVIRGSVASIFIDEISTDLTFSNFISVYDISMIKVIKTPFVGAVGNGAGGVIAIYTKRGDDLEE